jgi:hypothetical protein
MTRGTQTKSTSFWTSDPDAALVPASVDYAWSAIPGFAGNTPFFAVPLTTHQAADVEFGYAESRMVGAGNLVVLYNVGNALPADHLYVVTIAAEG